MVEFPVEFTSRILDFAGVEVEFERRGDEIVIRPKNPGCLRRELLDTPSWKVKEVLESLVHAQKAGGENP